MYCNSEKYRVEWRVLGCMRGQVGVVRSVFTYHSLIILHLLTETEVSVNKYFIIY